MTTHHVEFSYFLPEFGVMEIDLDPAIDLAEKEEIVLREINDVYPDVDSIEITQIKEI